MTSTVLERHLRDASSNLGHALRYHSYFTGQAAAIVAYARKAGEYAAYAECTPDALYWTFCSVSREALKIEAIRIAFAMGYRATVALLAMPGTDAEPTVPMRRIRPEAVR